MANRFISPNSCLERCSFIMHPLGLMEKKSPFTHPRLEAAFFLPSVSCDKTAWTWAPQWPWGPRRNVFCLLSLLFWLSVTRGQQSFASEVPQRTRNSTGVPGRFQEETEEGKLRGRLGGKCFFFSQKPFFLTRPLKTELNWEPDKQKTI